MQPHETMNRLKPHCSACQAQGVTTWFVNNDGRSIFLCADCKPEDDDE